MATKKVAKKAGKKTAAPRKVASKKAAAKRTPAKGTAVKKATAKKTTAKKPATRKAAPRKTAAKKRITPRKALSNTRKLLEAKQRQAHETPPWQQIGTPAARVHEGYQSPEAAAKAQELHEGESRLPAIHGSISTHDRHAQGRRDKR